jgi:16S rRNA (uracil1498-N3)-methyltransferase
MWDGRGDIRLFVEQALAVGAAVGLSPERAHYLRSVLRLSAGAPVHLFNGRDGEWQARLEALGKGWASCALERQVRAQAAEPDLWLAFAPIKRARIDFVAQKATELGVSALWPVFTRLTAVGRVNVARLRANAIEAAEQCGRLSVPEVFAPADFAELLAGWPAERRILLCDESGAGVPIAAALRDGGANPSPWAVMVGPEGGFARDELDRLRKLPIVNAVGLGPRLLRADTAALAALACWQALAGDWRGAHQEASSTIRLGTT